MMNMAQHILARRGIERAVLKVAGDDQRALGFYRGLGWHVAECDAAADEEGCILLAKEIAPA